MKLKIKKINKIFEIPINSDMQRIEQIKSTISNCIANPTPCEVEVFDMWSDLEDRQIKVTMQEKHRIDAEGKLINGKG